MVNDFLHASIIGLLILSIFWFFIIVFIFIRKPPKSKLTTQLIFKSLLLFLVSFGILFILLKSDSFW